MSGAISTAYSHRFAAAVNYTPSTSLTTTTYDGSGETTEPTWIAKPSWVTATCTDLLAHNPLPSGDDDFENPSLLMSNDLGSTWSTPPGLTNPIAPKPTTVGLPGNNADCFLVSDPNVNRLIMFWAVMQDPAAPGGINSNGFYYSICTSVAMTSWGARVQLLSINGGNLLADGKEQEPKVLYNPLRDRWWMWTQHDGTDVIRWRESTTSSPIGAFSQPTICNISLPGEATGVWHMSIIRETSGRYIMVICDSHNPGGGIERQGWLASSFDGINWKVAPRPFMKVNSWAVSGVYRPTIIPARSGAGYDVIVARHQNPTSRLGLVRNIPKTEIP